MTQRNWTRLHPSIVFLVALAMASLGVAVASAAPPGSTSGEIVAASPQVDLGPGAEATAALALPEGPDATAPEEALSDATSVRPVNPLTVSFDTILGAGPSPNHACSCYSKAECSVCCPAGCKFFCDGGDLLAGIQGLCDCILCPGE